MSDRQLSRSELEGSAPTRLVRTNHGIDAKPLGSPIALKGVVIPRTGVYSVGIKVGLSAVVWFLAVTWLNFVGGIETNLRFHPRNWTFGHVPHSVFGHRFRGHQRSAMEPAQGQLDPSSTTMSTSIRGRTKR